MPGKVSNPRDLLVLLLGELLHVERRLAGDVIRAVAGALRDEELAAAFERHLDATREHVVRLEAAFRRIDVAPTANLSRPFESAVAQHEELAGHIVDPGLARQFHLQSALHVEYWEMASYEVVISLAPRELVELLEPSLEEERRFATQLLEHLESESG